MDRALIDTAVDALSVQAVLLQGTSVSASEKVLPPVADDLSISTQHRAGPGESSLRRVTTESDETIDMVIFEFFVGVRLVDREALEAAAAHAEAVSSGDVHLEITAVFSAHYRLKHNTDMEALEPAMEEFGACNVGFHVWPYWREYVQSTCARLGIPTIPISMYKLPQFQSELDEA